MSETLRLIVSAMAIGRIVLGIAPFVAAGLVTRVLGFPLSHDTPTARLMARFFGVRDLGLGVLVFYALSHPPIAAFVMLFNAATDGGDLIATLIPLIRRQGIDRAAGKSALMAASAGLGWLLVWGQMS